MNKPWKVAAQKLLKKTIGPQNTERLQFFKSNGYFPNLATPLTFNEKISWRKFHERDPRFSKLIDKIEAKSIVADLIGPQHLIPTLAVYDRPEDVSLDWPLPFVVKATHASGTNLFIRSEADKAGAMDRLRVFAAYDHGALCQEWAYNFPARILVEPMVLDNGQTPSDFKCHVFGGKVFAIQVDIDRFTNHKRSFFSPSWELMEATMRYPGAGIQPPPVSLPAMIDFAELIARDFSYARVDFYELDGKPLFGEVTFYPEGGYGRFTPRKWDRIFGDKWDITRFRPEGHCRSM